MANVVPVVFCFDKRIILGASVAIKSLIDCAKPDTTYDIRVFHSDLSLVNQKNINKLVDGTRHNIAFHYINPKTFNGLPKSNGSWTEIVYYRLIIPEILKEYDRAIYSDVDVLFKGDLSELYNIDISYYQIPSDVFTEKLREETGLFLHNGLHYGSNGANYIRMNVATSLENVKDAMNRLSNFLKDKEK